MITKKQLIQKINKYINENLDSTTLEQLIDMEMESSELPRSEPIITAELQNIVEQYEDDLMKTLEYWVRKNAGKIYSGFDAFSLFEEEGPYLVLMTLRGEGVGIWDGSWDQFFVNPKEAIESLSSFLKKRLGKYADDTGGGKINDALRDAAYESSNQVEESAFMEGNNSKKTEHSGAKHGKGAYYGKKHDAKKESNKKRRAQDKKEAMKKEDLSN